MGGSEGSFALPFFLSFFPLCIPLSAPSFHFGSTNIAARGGAGWSEQEEAEVVGQALAWPVIREADPALSGHSGKQSKQEFTIAGLSDPFTYIFPTSVRLSGGMCPELLQAILPLQHMAFWADFESRKQCCRKGQKWC